MKLENYHEMVGTLEKYEENADNLKLHFVYKQSIELPKNALPTEKLEECKQKEIGIFHLDGKYCLKKQVHQINSPIVEGSEIQLIKLPSFYLCRAMNV